MIARLKDICNINPKSPGFQDELTVSFVPMLKVGENGEFDPSEVRTYQEVKKGFTFFQNGDVLFAKITPCMENGKGAIAQSLENGVGFGSTEFHVLRPIPECVTSKWLFYLLSWQAFRKEAEKNMIGSAGQKRVPKSFLEKYIVDLPDLDTQKGMTDTLDRICDLLSLRKQQLAKLDELVKARFVEMFGDLKHNSMDWSVYTFNDFASIDTTMIHDFTEYGEYPHIGIDSIEKDTGNLSGYRTVKEDGVISGKYLFTPEHIIYSKIRPNLNKVALPDFAGVCSADAYPILPKKEKCNRVFLAYTLRNPVFLDYILAFSNRTNLPKVNKQQVEGFCCPIPDIELQEKFSSFFGEVARQKLTIQQSLDKLEVLRKSLMQEYFR